MKANQSGLYILSLIQLNVKHSEGLPKDLIILLISNYFKDKWVHLASQANLSVMNMGDCAILASLTGDKRADDQIFFFFPHFFFYIPNSNRTPFSFTFTHFLSCTFTSRPLLYVIYYYLPCFCGEVHLWLTLKDDLPGVTYRVQYSCPCGSDVWRYNSVLCFDLKPLYSLKIKYCPEHACVVVVV